MTARKINSPYEEFNDLAGLPMDDAYIYIGADSLDPVANPITVYSDVSLSTAITQPIRTIGGVPVVNSAAVDIYADVDYSIKITNSAGATIRNITSVVEPADPEWVNSKTATYSSTTIFTLVGDQTATYEVGRAVRVTSSGPTYAYATISTSVYGSVTTVTLDDTVVPAGITTAETSIVGPNSVPTDPQVATNTTDIATNVTNIALNLPLAGGTMSGDGMIVLGSGTPEGAEAAKFSQIPTNNTSLTNGNAFVTGESFFGFVNTSTTTITVTSTLTSGGKTGGWIDYMGSFGGSLFYGSIQILGSNSFAMRETKLDNKNLRIEFKEVFKKIEAKHNTSVESCKLVYDRVDELERKNISEDSHEAGWKGQWALIGAVLVALAAILSAFLSYEQYAHPVKVEKTK